jgi:hypothetical protein
MALPAIAAGIGIGSKLLGGLFGGKSKKKKAEADRKAAIGAAELKNQMGEDERLAKLSAGQSLLGQLTGKGFTNIDPATAAKLGQRRTYDFGKAVPEAGAGGGSELLSGLFGGVADVAGQYGANAQDMIGMSPGQPAVPMQETPGVPDLRSRVGEFDTGIDYTLYPRG